MENLRIDDMTREPSRLRRYYGNGGARIVDVNDRVLAEIPAAVEPVPPEPETEEAAVDSEWLD